MTDLTVREYAEQRKWDSYVDDEDAQSLSSADVFRREGAEIAYLDIMHFIDGVYRPEFLEAVADRIYRRKLIGPGR